MENENWILARKPLSEKSIADNVLKWGTGGINIDVSRIQFISEIDKENAKPGSLNATGEYSSFGYNFNHSTHFGNEQNEQGRFPANFIYCGDDEVLEEFDKAGNRKSGAMSGIYKNTIFKSGIRNGKDIELKQNKSEGSAARFFYNTKE